jgi:MarR family transcriptional regulator, organic hydroperoxide resistance regulator
MKRVPVSTPRMARYIPLIREFATRDELLHDAVARRLGLHSTDEKVLRLLGDKALTAGDLVAHTGLTGAAVTALVDRLERFGYVTRLRDSEDRRKVAIRAVAARLREINRIYKGLNDAMEALLAEYQGAEFAVIVDYLTRATRILAEQAASVGGEAAQPKRKSGERRITNAP